METLEQLKSKAYDLIAQFEAVQTALKEVNQKIIDFKSPEEVKEAEVEEVIK